MQSLLYLTEVSPTGPKKAAVALTPAFNWKHLLQLSSFHSEFVLASIHHNGDRRLLLRNGESWESKALLLLLACQTDDVLPFGRYVAGVAPRPNPRPLN
ncbi:hypothetical protein KIP88_43230 [Bradyrhizobium sp. SRL28]|uniref:hypothetical protein n=1 Tax=Bradyrhizobium sp. SRL28 TaxID=2836178 RepID=UPI001BDE91C8|nr:hypothetical protein [Bradyrhizobium sp. SRL28]MBT1517160.1 hypothetical protein [Bradyrhizobium sp. SRL28]